MLLHNASLRRYEEILSAKKCLEGNFRGAIYTTLDGN